MATLSRSARGASKRAASSVSARPPSLPAWGAVCFFVSGAAGLIYEVVWSKQISYLMGNSLHAVATVVSAFVCGLALGGWGLGDRLACRGRCGRHYAGVEIG